MYFNEITNRVWIKKMYNLHIVQFQLYVIIVKIILYNISLFVIIVDILMYL